MESPFLELFKSCLDMVLGNVVQVALLEQGGWTRCPPEVSSNINISVIPLPGSPWVTVFAVQASKLDHKGQEVFKIQDPLALL